MSSSEEPQHYCEICLWSSKSKIGNGPLRAIFAHHMLVHVNKDDKFRLAFLHRRQHRGSKQVKVQCDYCSKMSLKAKAFNHFVTFHSNLSESDKQIYRGANFPAVTKQCDVCHQEIHPSMFYGHFLVKHNKLSDMDKHICDCCECAFLENRNLAMHWLRMHTAPISEGHQKRIECDICLRKFYFQNHAPTRDFYQHFLIRHSKVAEKFVCDVCNHATTRPGHLWSHVNRAGHLAQTQFDKLVCDICGIELMHKERVLVHYRFKHLNKNELETFDCEKCGFSTNIKFLLSAHSMEHCMLKSVRYECEDCEGLFKTRIALGLHKRDGHKNKQYVCDVCDRSFIRKNALLDSVHCTNFVG